MENTISFKIFLMSDNSNELEVRRFEIPSAEACNFSLFSKKIIELFPSLSEKGFTVYWKDTEEDDITVSSNEEFAIALSEMRANIKKIYIKINNAESTQINNDIQHYMIFCDECKSNIVGFRYKCVVCHNFDLCSKCERLALHPEHPMLRIPNPFTFNYNDLDEIIQFLGTFVESLPKSRHHSHHSHHRKGHSYKYYVQDFCKKKRKHDKHGSGLESDNLEESNCKKHSGVKLNSCVHNALLNDFINTFGSLNLNSENHKAGESKKSDDRKTSEGAYINYLKSVKKTITSFLDPLGIEIDFDISTKEEKKDTAEQQPEGVASTSAAPAFDQKEVQNASPEKNHSDKKDKTEDILEKLASQISGHQNQESTEKDDWVSLEELKRDCENFDNGVENAGKVDFKVPQENTNQTTASSKEPQNLYPNLSSSNVSQNPFVLQSLEKMLSMGFTNEGDWLIHLLEAKNGNIEKALEVLDHCKNF